MTKLVRISENAYKKLNKLSEKTGSSKQALLDIALEKLSRSTLLAEANEAYESLRENKTAWEEEQKERELWDATLQDGLENE